MTQDQAQLSPYLDGRPQCNVWRNGFRCQKVLEHVSEEHLYVRAEPEPAPSVGAQELADDLLDCIARLLSVYRNCPLCERQMPGHHAPDCEYLTLRDRVAALAPTQPPVAFVQPPIKGNPPCHICGGKMHWLCSKCGASSLPTEDVCPKCGKSDNFLVVAGRRVCMNHEGELTQPQPSAYTTPINSLAPGEERVWEFSTPNVEELARRMFILDRTDSKTSAHYWDDGGHGFEDTRNTYRAWAQQALKALASVSAETGRKEKS